MPILGGLFSRRDKHKLQPQSYAPYKQSNSSDGDADSASIVETVESSLPNSPSSLGSPPVPRSGNPVYGNSPLASSSKIKLGFRRKKSSNFVHVEKHDIPNASSPLPAIPRPAYSPSAFSEPDVDRFRPPAKGALFSAYGDPQGALSTRSLPSNKPASHSRSNSRDVVSADNLSSADIPPPQQQPSKKSGGLFSWARDRKKSQPSASRTPERPPPRPSLDLNAASSPGSHGYDSDSFNLKAFRHVGPAESPVSELPVPRPPSALSGTFNTPPARPRGDSVASDASQRISVAAFREAAARRNNSPSPTVTRPPSRGELSSSRLDVSSSRPSMGLRPGMGAVSSTSPKPSPKPSPARISTLRPASDDSSLSESEDEDSEDDEEGTLRPNRGDTVTQRNLGPKAAASSSELGHRLRVPAPGPERVARATLGREEADIKRAEIKSADLASLTKGNASTSALQANAVMERPSTMLALASSGMHVPLTDCVFL